MKPNRGETAGQEFQAPQPEVDGLERAQEKSREAPPSQESSAGNQASAPPIAIPVSLPVSEPPAALTQSDDHATAATPAAPVNNPDRIERQWIDQVKSVVAETRSDPYKQKHEMSKVKASYIKKRFNKVIKTDEAI